MFGTVFVVLLALWASSPQSPAPDLVLRNGHVVTVDAAKPEAEAIAIRGGRILAVGTNAEVDRLTGPATRVIDLAGRLAIPGFIEGHGHFVGLGQARQILDLTKAKTWDDIVSMVGEAARTAAPGAWILGRGWHQEKWAGRPVPAVEGFPTHASLDRVSPANPVLLTHASGHAAMVNAKALELAGVTAATPNPSGGEILKDAAGEPTGLLREAASGLVERQRRRAESSMTEAERTAATRRAIDVAVSESLSKGITSFQDAGASFAAVDLFKAVAAEGKLGLRLWVMVRESPAALNARLAAAKVVGAADHHLTVAAIKVSLDGALGTRGAWLLEPYADLPSGTGLNTVSLESLRATAAVAAEQGVQLAVHAIGDRANREALNVFEETFAAHPARKDWRWRIEHAQHLHPSDIPRFGRLGVIASMQGIHCTSDAPYVLARLGPARAEEGAYVWQKLLKSGATVTNGTDTPVEDVDPIASFYATVSRKLADGTVFYGDQRMSRLEALRSYTLSNAYAAFEEGIKGSLTPGKLADIVVLTKDIMRIPEDEIPSARVVMTIVGGAVVYQDPLRQ